MFLYLEKNNYFQIHVPRKCLLIKFSENCVVTFDKYLSHRDVIVKQYLNKIIDDVNFNTINRRLNILKFLTLYNVYIKENNCDWSWEYLAQSIINNMMKCFVI